MTEFCDEQLIRVLSNELAKTTARAAVTGNSKRRVIDKTADSREAELEEHPKKSGWLRVLQRLDEREQSQNP